MVPLSVRTDWVQTLSVLTDGNPYTLSEVIVLQKHLLSPTPYRHHNPNPHPNSVDLGVEVARNATLKEMAARIESIQAENERIAAAE